MRKTFGAAVTAIWPLVIVVAQTFGQSTPGDQLAISLPGGATMEFVYCPPGSFEMGSNESVLWVWCHPCEQPVHTVTFAQGFWMGKYEVTQAQWRAIMGGNPANNYGVGDNYPVYYISYDLITGADGFVARLNAHLRSTNQGPATFRLPSEAEWEYACRAGTTTRFSYGDSNCSPAGCDSCDLDAYGWWCGNDAGQSGTKPVGGKLPNPWGLYDMHGNVWEWCQDWWHGDYYGAPTDGSAWMTGDATNRVLKSGAWNNTPRYAKTTTRRRRLPTSSTQEEGFRLAMPLPLPTESASGLRLY